MRNVPVRTTHLGRVAAVNALSREIAETNMSLGEAEYRLAAAQRIPFPKDWVQLVSGMGGAFSFAMIFGGDLRSAIAAAVARRSPPRPSSHWCASCCVRRCIPRPAMPSSVR